MSISASATRLDRLWQRVVSAPQDDSAWIAFYEALSSARLFLPLEEGAGRALRPKVIETGEGKVALAFDSEDRLASAISAATEFAAMPGADLCSRLAGQGIGLALNPGAPSETILEAATLGWIAAHLGADVSRDEVSGRVVAPPPDAALLDALGRRVADFGAHLGDAWLVGLSDAADEVTELALVLRPEGAGQAMADEMATALTRVGQLVTAHPFAVATARESEPLLDAARRVGIRLGA